MEMLKSHQMHNYLKNNECYKTNTSNNDFKNATMLCKHARPVLFRR